MGRPTKLTTRIQDKICAALRGGLSPVGASSFAGIDRATFYRWLDLGKRGRSKRYVEFRKAVEEAKSNLEGRVTTKLLKAIDEGRLELAIPFLERRFPDRWGKRDHVKIAADVNVQNGLKIVPARPFELPEEEPDPTAPPKAPGARPTKTKKAQAEHLRDEDR